MIRAVFFDLFETLITEFDPDWRRSTPVWKRLSLDAEAFRQEWRSRRRERHIGTYRDYAAVLRDICRAMGKPFDEDLIQQLQANRLASKAVPFSIIGDDIVDMLQDLREKELKLGLISNCEPGEVAAWPNCRVAPFFHDVVFSFEVGYVKPDPEIYQIACQRMGVEAEESVFVGDGGNKELGGAAKVGMFPLRSAWFSAQWAQHTGSELRDDDDAAYPRIGTPAELCATLNTYLDASR